MAQYHSWLGNNGTGFASSVASNVARRLFFLVGAQKLTCQRVTAILPAHYYLVGILTTTTDKAFAIHHFLSQRLF